MALKPSLEARSQVPGTAQPQPSSMARLYLLPCPPLYADVTMRKKPRSPYGSPQLFRTILQSPRPSPQSACLASPQPPLAARLLFPSLPSPSSSLPPPPTLYPRGRIVVEKMTNSKSTRRHGPTRTDGSVHVCTLHACGAYAQNTHTCIQNT